MSARPNRYRHGSRRLGVVAALCTLALSGAACSSGGGPSSAAKDKVPTVAATQPFARLDPAAFAARAGDKGAVLINVHIPYEGELEHTTAFIPYEHIVGDARLPQDKSTEILLYCRSGRMSEIAGNALHAAGYTNLAHLEGGMQGWEAAGRTLLQNPAHATETTATHPM